MPLSSKTESEPRITKTFEVAVCSECGTHYNDSMLGERCGQRQPPCWGTVQTTEVVAAVEYDLARDGLLYVAQDARTLRAAKTTAEAALRGVGVFPEDS